MRNRLNAIGTRPIARRRHVKPPRRRYGGVKKRLTEQDDRVARANAALRAARTGACAGGYRIADARHLARGWIDRVADGVFDYPVTPVGVERFMAQPAHAMMLAQLPDHDRVVGQARGMIHYQPDGPPQLYLDNLGVAPGHQRKGVATALVNALAAWADRHHGAQLCWLGTEPDNHQATGFYRALGFRAEPMLVFERDRDSTTT